MPLPVQFVPTAFSLATVCCWGTSDFLGGYATRRANAFLLTTLSHAAGFTWMLGLTSAEHTQLPSSHAIVWAVLGGASGGIALAMFYRALATGRMGLNAPVAAVIGAAIPTVVGMLLEGFPGVIRIAGFLLAAVGIWLISRTEDRSSPEGLGLAALSGIGFAGFYLCMRQAGAGSALWIASFSRGSALVITLIVVLLQRNFRDLTPASAILGMLAGCLDVSGTAMFVRASQTGRLDTAVVLTSLYPAITVLLARLILKEHFTRWKAVGMFAALLAVPMIAG